MSEIFKQRALRCWVFGASPCFFIKKIDTKWVMQSISRRLPLLSRTFPVFILVGVDLRAYVN